MNDYACRCVPANYPNSSQTAACMNGLNSLTYRVTALEETVVNLDNRITILEGGGTVEESPFIVVDNEAQLDAALLVGKHILLRGEGNGGVIDVTGTKQVVVPGTRIWGYGYGSTGAPYFSKIKARFPSLPAWGTGSANIFDIRASDVEFAGFEIEGRDANDTVFASYTPFNFIPGFTTDRVHIHDVYCLNVHNVFVRLASPGVAPARNITIERVKALNVSGSAVYARYGLHDCRFLNNHFVMRASGAPNIFPSAQGFRVDADMNDLIIQGNKIENPGRMGIELTSIVQSGTTMAPMRRNRILDNTILNASSMGISHGFHQDGIIDGNTIDGASGIGIESSAGFSLGQSGAPHNNIISRNYVSNVTGTSWVSGIIADKSVGDVIRDNVVRGVASSQAGAGVEFYSRGLMAYGAAHVSFMGNRVFDVDGVGCYVQNGPRASMDVQAVVQDNHFRVTPAQSRARFAVYVFDSRCVVRNNVAWEPSGGPALQAYGTNLNDPAFVYPGSSWTNPVRGAQQFEETNLRLAY